jgi:hypothetical protein
MLYRNQNVLLTQLNLDHPLLRTSEPITDVQRGSEGPSKEDFNDELAEV